MTKLQFDSSPVIRETSQEYRGRAVVVEIYSGRIVYRLKGTQQRIVLDHLVGIECGLKVAAREDRVKV